MPVILEAFIFIVIIVVEIRTLASTILAAILGAWFGAGTVCAWPKRKIQMGLGVALLVADFLTLGAQLHWYATGGDELGLTGTKLWIAVACNFMLGAVMQLGCWSLRPVYDPGLLARHESARRLSHYYGLLRLLDAGRELPIYPRGRYHAKAAVGLTVGGIPAILVAAYMVKSLPLGLCAGWWSLSSCTRP